MHRPIWQAGALAVLVLVTLTSCGGDDDDATSSSAPATTVGSGTADAPTATAPRQPGAISEETTDAGETSSTVPSSPPTTGDITEVVEVPAQSTLPPVALDESVSVPDVAEVEVASIERVEAEARLPGEVAGPALAVTLRIENTGDEPLDLATVTVNLYDADGGATAPLTAPPAAPFEGQLEPGDDAEATYLFEFGDPHTEPITVEVIPAVASPIVVFAGPLP